MFNRSIKNSAQISAVQGTSFRKGLLELLASFRSTAPEHGKSPSQLLFGWNMRSDSDIRNPSAFSNGGARARNPTQSSMPLGERKRVVQQKFEKRRYGKNTIRKRGPYKEGQWVTTKLPSAEVQKGCNPRSAPQRILEALGNYTYKLDSGQIWNARKLMRYRGPTHHDLELEHHHLAQRNKLNTGVPVVPAAQPESMQEYRQFDLVLPLSEEDEVSHSAVGEQ